MSEEEQEELTQHCCPGCGSCSGMFTANSMNCLAEALGMACPETEPFLPITASALPWRNGRA